MTLENDASFVAISSTWILFLAKVAAGSKIEPSVLMVIGSW